MTDEQETLYDGSKEDEGNSSNSSTGDQPLLVSRKNGVAAWLNNNGNGAYLSVKMPLGLGTVHFSGPNDEAQRLLDLLYNTAKEHGYLNEEEQT